MGLCVQDLSTVTPKSSEHNPHVGSTSLGFPKTGLPWCVCVHVCVLIIKIATHSWCFWRAKTLANCFQCQDSVAPVLLYINAMLDLLAMV